MSWQQASLNSPEKARGKSLKNGWWGVGASGIRLMKTSVSIVPAKYAESCRYFESLKALDLSHYTRKRMITHLNRCSQKKYHRPKGMSHYQYLQELELQRL
jgi:hypothetical protein